MPAASATPAVALASGVLRRYLVNAGLKYGKLTFVDGTTDNLFSSNRGSTGGQIDSDSGILIDTAEF